MNRLEERNLVWNLVEEIIKNHDLEISSEFLDPLSEDEMIFGNFIKGHPMSFGMDLRELIADITRKLPSDYEIVKCYEIDTGNGVIGIMKR